MYPDLMPVQQCGDQTGDEHACDQHDGAEAVMLHA